MREGAAHLPESHENRNKRVIEIIDILSREFPDSQCSLNYSCPLELLIATILSAQCTDVRVNKVTPMLFKKYSSPKHYVRVSHEELGEEIRSTGFYNNKAKSIQNCCCVLLDEHNGRVPDTLEALVKLPGVGRKTANVILGNAFGIPGIVVDTHVKRLSNRLGLTANSNPDKIEMDLNAVVPQREWTHFSHVLIDHGRKTCRARKPICSECPVNSLCPSREP